MLDPWIKEDSPASIYGAPRNPGGIPCNLRRCSLQLLVAPCNFVGRAPCNHLRGSSQPWGNSLQPQTVLLATLGVSLRPRGQGSLQPSMGLLATLGGPLQPRTALLATLGVSLQPCGQGSLQPFTKLLATLGGFLQLRKVLLFLMVPGPFRLWLTKFL